MPFPKFGRKAEAPESAPLSAEPLENEAGTNEVAPEGFAAEPPPVVSGLTAAGPAFAVESADEAEEVPSVPLPGDVKPTKATPDLKVVEGKPNRRPLLLGGLAAVAAVAAFASFGFAGHSEAPKAKQESKSKGHRVVAATPEEARSAAKAKRPKMVLGKKPAANMPGALPTHAPFAKGAKGAKPKSLLTPAQQKVAIQRKYDDMSRFVMKRDLASLTVFFKAMTAPEFAYVDKHKAKTNRDQLLEQMARQMKEVKRFVRSSNKVVAWKPGAGIGKATVISDFAMVFPTKNGKGSTLTGQSTTVDTWVKGRTGWKLKSVVTVKESAKLNGKPM